MYAVLCTDCICYSTLQRTLLYTCDNMDSLKLEGGDIITIHQYADVSTLHRLPYFKVNYTAILKGQGKETVRV